MKRQARITVPVTLILYLLLMVASAGASGDANVDLKCGSYCLYVSLKALDLTAEPFAAFEKRIGEPGLQGYSLGKLAEVARSYGGHTLGLQTNIANLERRPGSFACIAKIDKAHFVNIAAIEGQEVHLVDPPNHKVMPRDTFEAVWDGTVLLIARTPLDADAELPRRSFYVLWACAAAGTVGLSYAASRLWKGPR